MARPKKNFPMFCRSSAYLISLGVLKLNIALVFPDSCRSMIGAMLALALSIEDDGTSLHT